MQYTHGDTFKPMKDRLTLTSHWHAKLTVSEMAEKSRVGEFSRLLKNMGVNIVHLAEFHGDGNPRDSGPKRLPQLQAMFDTCRKYSTHRFLLLPGEEANAHLNIPPPAKQKPGHWLYLFPKPVYLTLVRKKGQPFMEEIAPYGHVYHTGSEADMVKVLRREKGLAWTAHPRIKSSSAAPDAYRERDWYKDDSLWLGGGWKFMPGDLSDGRLGVRVLDLLDDMNRWGQHKKLIGEVDCFTVDSTHEIYGHMNVNYLRLKKMPTFDDWSPVLDVLRRGDFFVTTGEVLIHSFEATNDLIKADLEWTFPLRTVELVVDGRRQTVELPETREFGRKTFEWPMELKGKARARIEVWDVAGNGAFTQPLRLR